MKKIKIVPDIHLNESALALEERGQSMPFPMKKFLTVCVNMYQPFGKGFQGVSQGIKIKNAFESGNGSFKLEDVDYKALKQAVETAELQPFIAMSCEMYYRAVNEAVDVDINKK